MRKLLPIFALAFCRVAYAVCLWVVSIYPVTYQQFDKFHFGVGPTLSLACVCVALFFWQKQQKPSKFFPLQFAVLAFILMAIADLLYLWRKLPMEKVYIEIEYAILGDLVVAFAAGCIAFIIREKTRPQQT